jgi:hypothetical protein
LAADDKLLVHFETECVSVSRLQGSVLTSLSKERAAFEEGLAAGIPPDRLDKFCDGLKEFTAALGGRLMLLTRSTSYSASC